MNGPAPAGPFFVCGLCLTRGHVHTAQPAFPLRINGFAAVAKCLGLAVHAALGFANPRKIPV